MSAQLEFDPPASVTAQAPAMVALATKVGEPEAYQQAPVLSLKLAVSRYDTATVEARDDKEILVSFEDATGSVIDYADIPHDDLVAVFQAVDVLRAHLGRPKETSGLDITIQKFIPFDTHLGGRAATAAAVLVALSGLWDASIAREDLARMAPRIGDGVAAAITGGAIITHHNAIEELVTPVLVHSELAMVVVPAAADLGNAEMFEAVRQLRHTTDDEQHAVLEFQTELLQAVAQGDAKQVALMMHNEFQPALVSMLPEHNDWLTAGMDEDALAAVTVDRGPSLVFIADDMHAANELAERFEQRMEIAAVAEYGPVSGAHLV
ncbi:hypothetical protein GCM10009720_00660 [Yaniella flava]|uniref:GHMP kinase N-terminal domain-containing protein n=1 Tax=Yaniella flava TaxID=287930 RepID=A0ABN2U0B5_9MICC|nr:hypothetical protein [Micrococcaceae bacterium]